MQSKFMKHLSREELLDIAEGSRAEPPHVAECASCRGELQELRAVMVAVSEVDVPEPSPLFWDHFSARVREAVVREAAPSRTRWFGLGAGSWRIAVPAAALAAATVILLVVAFARRQTAPASSVTAAAQPVPSAPAPALSDALPRLTESRDPSFMFVSDLTDDMDIDTALEAGLVSDGSADHAISHLSDDELRTLAALLKAQLAAGQAS